jgi:hypothetical protein
MNLNLSESRIGIALILCGALALTGCGDFVSTDPDGSGWITAESFLSECDGFSSQQQALQVQPPTPDRGDDLYCDAERLYWEYDGGANRLILLNTRAMLNCCGEHDMDIEEIEGGYLVTETDDPGSEGRCLCTCPFDFLMYIDGVASGTVKLQLERAVTDWPEGSGTLIDVELDLSTGSGVFVIEESDASGFCEEPAA